MREMGALKEFYTNKIFRLLSHKKSAVIDLVLLLFSKQVLFSLYSQTFVPNIYFSGII